MNDHGMIYAPGNPLRLNWVQDTHTYNAAAMLFNFVSGFFFFCGYIIYSACTLYRRCTQFYYVCINNTVITLSEIYCIYIAGIYPVYRYGCERRKTSAFKRPVIESNNYTVLCFTGYFIKPQSYIIMLQVLSIIWPRDRTRLDTKSTSFIIIIILKYLFVSCSCVENPFHIKQLSHQVMNVFFYYLL